jgi:hypothetical protein
MDDMNGKDLVGTVYKGFKVLDYKRENDRSYIFVTCPICGKNSWRRKDLIDSNPYSCGCKKKPQYDDLTGQIFGRLKAIEKTDRYTKSGHVIWKCKCKCGNIVYEPSNVLKKGAAKSCECLAKECQSQNGKNVGKLIKDKYCIDGTNVLNLTSKIPKNNTSGIKGVTYDKQRCKWRAQIVFKGKNYNLGRYALKQDAIEARKTAEREFYGKFLDSMTYVEKESNGENAEQT